MFKDDEFPTSNTVQTAPAHQVPPDPEPPDAAAFLRAHPGAQRIFLELSGQSPHEQWAPAAKSSSSPEPAPVGQRFASELAMLSERRQKAGEMNAAVHQRAVDLTTDHLRSLLHFKL